MTQKENNLLKSHSNLQNAFMLAPVMICILRGPNHVFERANNKYMELIGHRDVINKTAREAFPELEEQNFVELLDNVYKTGKTYYGHETFAKIDKGNGALKDGYFNFTYQASDDANGNREGILMFVEEVTEQVISRKKIQENEKRFSNLVNQTTLPFAILKGEKMILESANESLFKIFNSGKESLGKPLLEILPEMKDQPFIGLLLDVFHSGVTHYCNEEPVYFNRENEEKEIVYFNFVYQPYYDDDAITTGVMVLANDVTELVLSRNKVEESEKRYNMMLMKSPFGFTVLKGKKMLITLANESIKEFWGKGEDVEGKPLFEVLSELKDSTFPSILEDVYNTGIPFYGDELLAPIFRNGKLEEAYFNFVYQPYFEADETISGVAIIAYEVTAQALVKKALAQQLDSEKKALTSIEESNKRYHNMLMHSPFAFSIMKGKDMVITLANDLIKELWGKGVDVEGKTLLEVLPELTHQPFPKLMDTVFTTGKPMYVNEILAQLQYQDTLQDKYFNVVYQPHYEADETISGVITIAYDVTEMVLARKKIEESEIKFRTLIEDAPVSTCFYTGREMTIEVANDIMLGYWGKGKDVIGKKVADAIPELKGQPFLKILDEVYMTGQIYEAKNAFAQVEVNGVLGNYYFDYTYKPIRNAAGEVYGILNMAVDVTEQVIATNRIKESEERFRTMADNIAQFAWMTDYKGYIYWYNQRWFDYTGSNLEEMEGWKWQKAVHPDMAEEVIKCFEKAIETGIDWEDTFLLRGKDGIYRWFLSRAIPVRDHHGNVIRWFGTNTDITEQKETNKKAETATLMAEEAMKAKQQFLSNMSHEIRTPMNAIIGFTNVLLKTKLDDKQKEFINAIKTSGDTLIVLINDILDLAKVDAGKMTFQLVPFKLSESIVAALHLFEIKIKEKKLKLVKQYDTAIPEDLRGDPARLHQIFINLVSNAVKFTAKGKIILRVQLLEEDDKKATIEFSIIDTGIGIPENKLEYIFGAFQQVTNETSNSFGGTGLGLAIVKQLIENQGGRLSVKSNLGKGSTFSFVLSFEKTIAETKAEKETEGTLSLKNIKSLVVEDVKLNQLLIKILLEDFGSEVDLADNGKIALEKLKINNYDIIFMDLQMPEMNGFEATDYIRNVMHSQIPIIALTANVTTMDHEKCKAFGMNDYISKPIDEKLLYTKIIKYLPKGKQLKNK